MYPLEMRWRASLIAWAAHKRRWQGTRMHEVRAAILGMKCAPRVVSVAPTPFLPDKKKRGAEAGPPVSVIEYAIVAHESAR